MSRTIEDTVEEVLPEGVFQRIRINVASSIPYTGKIVRVVDFDKDGNIIDAYWEGDRSMRYKHGKVKKY